jgi:hypothetical protein
MSNQTTSTTTKNRAGGRDDAAAFAGRVAGRRTARPAAPSGTRRRPQF